MKKALLVVLLVALLAVAVSDLVNGSGASCDPLGSTGAVCSTPAMGDVLGNVSDGLAVVAGLVGK